MVLAFMLSASIARAATFELPCLISLNGSFGRVESCARRSGHDVQISPKILKRVKFSGGEPAAFQLLNDGCYYLNRKGLARKTHCFDNGSDYFVEGLTRYVGTDGKFGFMDRNLNIVVPAQFDFVFPFEQGLARFCNGCKTLPMGEHSTVEGGSWGTVDKKGRVKASKQST